MMTRQLFRAIAATAIFSLSGLVQAIPVDWNIDTLIFGDGGTGSGSFTYDADTIMYSNINLTTTAGSLHPGDTYFDRQAGFDNPTFFLALNEIFSANLVGAGFFTLQFGTALSNAGGTASIIGFVEATCFAADCSTFGGQFPNRGEVSGRISSAASVPVPATLALLGLGLAGLGWSRRKKA